MLSDGPWLLVLCKVALKGYEIHCRAGRLVTWRQARSSSQPRGLANCGKVKSQDQKAYFVALLGLVLPWSMIFRRSLYCGTKRPLNTRPTQYLVQYVVARHKVAQNSEGRAKAPRLFTLGLSFRTRLCKRVSFLLHVYSLCCSVTSGAK